MAVSYYHMKFQVQTPIHLRGMRRTSLAMNSHLLFDTIHCRIYFVVPHKLWEFVFEPGILHVYRKLQNIVYTWFSPVSTRYSLWMVWVEPYQLVITLGGSSQEFVYKMVLTFEIVCKIRLRIDQMRKWKWTRRSQLQPYLTVATVLSHGSDEASY